MRWQLVVVALVGACGARTELWVLARDAGEVADGPFRDGGMPALLSIAENHACYRSAQGVLVCWGGDVGPDGGYVARVNPQLVATAGLPVQVTTNSDDNCILDTSGDVYCWGWDDAFQRLGADTTTPQPAPGIRVVSGAVALVGTVTPNTNQCARMTEGSVTCWGYTPICDPTIADSGVYFYKTTPAPRPDLEPVFDTLALGQGFACGVRAGAVECCGSLLGNGTPLSTSISAALVPAAIHGRATAVAAGPLATACALIDDGTAQCWGWNKSGGLGDGTTTNRWSPVTVLGLTSATQLAVGSYHTCARLADGTARCWGDNSHGELGDGTTTQRPTPVAVLSSSGTGVLSEIVDLHAGYDFTCALLTSGDVYCWGWNDYGQVGDGTTTDHALPTKVIGL